MNDMLRTAIVALLSAVAGALLVLLLAGDQTPSMPAATDASGSDELRERIAALENKLTTTGVLDELPPRASTPENVDTAADPAAEEEEPREQRFAERREQQTERFATRLREAGWSDAEIDSLSDLRARAALELEQQQYETLWQRLQEDPEELSRWRDRQSVMRTALGDEKYEQFLEAAGRPTAAEIQNILTGSAGESAGLQLGDRIRRYGSTRVFNDRDLMIAQLDGEPGEPVSIEVERNGTIFYLTVPRGPLGTSRAARFGRDF